MKQENVQHIETTESDSFRRKTDIFYGDPLQLLELAKKGGVAIHELQDFLIHIKNPDEVEKRVIETTEDVELLVMKILEQGSEVIDYSSDHLYRSNDRGEEDMREKIEALQKKYIAIKERMCYSFVQDIVEINPHSLKQEDIILTNFLYKQEEQSVSVDMICCINGLYTSKISGDCYIETSHDNGHFIGEIFSLPITDLIIHGGRRHVDIFQNGVFSGLPKILQKGLHERFIVKMQVFSKEPRKIQKTSIFNRFFGKK